MDTSDVKPDAYGVWDTQEHKWFKSRNKYAWVSKSAAANSWNAENGATTWCRGKQPLFSAQARFVTKGLRFVAID